MHTTDTNLVSLTANAIRGLAMDAVEKANSGHPGMPMGMADVAAVLWLKHLRYSAKDPRWLGRDRFVLSAGHGSMLLYSLLHLAGYDLSLDDLKAFRQWDSKTPGHPEVGDTPGVETTTGPLGQGFANGIGMAIAAQMEAAQTGCPLLKTRVIGIVSDGDLMEGISQEAASLAGHLQLDNLLYIYDDNRITIDGRTELTYREDVGLRFRALGWDVLPLDAHDPEQVEQVLDRALGQLKRPTLIVARSEIAKGSPNKQGTSESHGAPLGKAEIAATKKALGMTDAEFHVPDAVRAVFAARTRHVEAERSRWNEQFEAWKAQHPDGAARFAALRHGKLPADLLAQLVAAAGTDASVATRVLSGKVIQKVAALTPRLVGGSADLASSTKTDIKATTSIGPGQFTGRNFHFGIREHAMGALMNGIALHGAFQPLGSTFLVFSDYMRPSIRLAALMRQPCAFVFTHDSLMVGEDGPTHQPIEHVASLRLIPNLDVLRPADALEVAAAWTHTLTRTDGPVAMCLTRQNLPALARAPGFDPRDILRGGYVLRDAPAAKATLLATGSEVSLAVAAADELARRGKPVRVVSVPCLEVFLRQDDAWRSRVLGTAPTFALEMGRPEIWCQLTGSLARVIGVSRFGASAPHGVLLEKFGFTATAVADRIAAQLP